MIPGHLAPSEGFGRAAVARAPAGLGAVYRQPSPAFQRSPLDRGRARPVRLNWCAMRPMSTEVPARERPRARKRRRSVAALSFSPGRQRSPRGDLSRSSGSIAGKCASPAGRRLDMGDVEPVGTTDRRGVDLAAADHHDLIGAGASRLLLGDGERRVEVRRRPARRPARSPVRCVTTMLSRPASGLPMRSRTSCGP